METVANTTLTWQPSNGSFPLKDPPPAISVVALLAVAIWIIVSNLLILLCLVISQHALQHRANLQILSLCITDMFSGIFALLLILSYKITASFPTFEACATIWYGYNTSQAASLFHALGICLHRLLIIKQRTNKTDVLRKDICKDVYKKMFLEILLIWIVSGVIVAVPFVSYGQFGKQLKQCSYRVMFENHADKVVVILSVVYLTPQCSMNAVYIYILRFLLTKWRRTNLMTQPPTVAASSSSTLNPDGSDKHPMFQASCSAKPKTVKLNTDGNGSSDESASTSNAVAGQGKILRQEKALENTPAGTDSKYDKTNRETQIHVKLSGYRRQMDVLITIGLIILVMNVCIMPFYFTGIITTTAGIRLKQNIKAIFMCVPFINSALNPIIYALRIKPFRKVLTITLNKCGSYLNI